jgi:hypothetical protein
VGREKFKVEKFKVQSLIKEYIVLALNSLQWALAVGNDSLQWEVAVGREKFDVQCSRL